MGKPLVHNGALFFFFLVLPPGRITGYGPAPAQQCFVWPTINIFQSTTLDAAQVSSRGIVLFRNRLKSGVELLLLLNKVACRVVQTSRKLPVVVDGGQERGGAKPRVCRLAINL